MIEFVDITHKYHYDSYNLFEQLSFTLHDGVNTVLCDIQSGKSTLCKMLLGLVKPTNGAVLLDGTDVFAMSAPVDALYLPQNPTFFEGRSVLYNLQYPLKVRKQPCQQRAEQLATQFQLQDLLSTKVKKLSPQQKQRLALARGCTVFRNVVLFDSFFDDTLSENFAPKDILPLFSHSKTQVIFTSCAHLAMGHTVVIQDKKCVFQGDSQQAQQVVSNLTWLARGIENCK